MVRCLAARGNRIKAGRRESLVVLKPGDEWHGFTDLAENHVLVDPIKVTISVRPFCERQHAVEHGIPAAVVTKFSLRGGLRSRRQVSIHFLSCSRWNHQG